MELTANRADCFSMIGMALEVGAVFKRKVTLPSINGAESGMPIQGRAAVHISDARYCKRFCGRLIENIKMGRSPMWMENRLRSNGIRPINNIVDAANYVMLEIGQPLHTYDYDKVEGNELTCRFAGEKENLKTLDGVERILHHTDLVIADKAGNPVCIAGVMGDLTRKLLIKQRVYFWKRQCLIVLRCEERHGG